MRKIWLLLCAITCTPAIGASVVATVGNTPITDTDITARTKILTRMGHTSTNNRRDALQAIIDDNVKLTYASNFGVTPAAADIDKEMKRLRLNELGGTDLEMAQNAVRADIAWQIVVARTVLPLVDISDEDIAAEKNALMRAQGLPIEMTIVRLTDIPDDVAKKLTRPKNCDDAVKMAEDMGGVPQKFTAVQYELAEDIRDRVVGLTTLQWSPRVDGSVLLVCGTKKTAEYGKLDDMIKQNTLYKRALFIADQQLKQLRRKAVIVIHDDRYKL